MTYKEPIEWPKKNLKDEEKELFLEIQRELDSIDNLTFDDRKKYAWLVADFVVYKKFIENKPELDDTEAIDNTKKEYSVYISPFIENLPKPFDKYLEDKIARLIVDYSIFFNQPKGGLPKIARNGLQPRDYNPQLNGHIEAIKTLTQNNPNKLKITELLNEIELETTKGLDILVKESQSVEYIRTKENFEIVLRQLLKPLKIKNKEIHIKDLKTFI